MKEITLKVGEKTLVPSNFVEAYVKVHQGRLFGNEKRYIAYCYISANVRDITIDGNPIIEYQETKDIKGKLWQVASDSLFHLATLIAKELNPEPNPDFEYQVTIVE